MKELREMTGKELLNEYRGYMRFIGLADRARLVQLVAELERRLAPVAAQGAEYEEVKADPVARNYPKCANCKQLGCNAGKVNHESNSRGERLGCLLCDCPQFHEAPEAVAASPQGADIETFAEHLASGIDGMANFAGKARMIDWIRAQADLFFAAPAPQVEALAREILITTGGCPPLCDEDGLLSKIAAILTAHGWKGIENNSK